MNVFGSIVRQLKRIGMLELLSIVVLAITLLVPSWLYILKQGTKGELQTIQRSAKIAVFMGLNASEATAKQAAKTIQSYKEVESVEYVSAQAATDTFKAHSGFGKQLEVLGDKLLPQTLFVQPKNVVDQNQLLQLTNKLDQLPGVDLVRLDSYWSEKLVVLLGVLDRMSVLLVFGFMFVFAVVVFFVTKVLLASVANELKLKLLLGATHQSLRWHYVHKAIWLGGVSAILSLAIMAISVWWLRVPLEGFVQQFGIDLGIKVLSIAASLVLLGLSIAVAAAVTWITCSRVLYRIDQHLEQADQF